MLTVIGIGAGFALVGPTSATAADLPTAYAEGQFLSGTLLGADLSGIVAIGSAEASNNGTQPTQEERDMLSVALFGDTIIEHEGYQADVDDVATSEAETDGGVLSQYARADKGGFSVGASGAIGSSGAIQAGDKGSPWHGELVVRLDEALDDDFAQAIAALRLELGAVSARASANLDVASGDYRLDDARLVFTSLALAGLTGRVSAAVAPLEAEIAAMTGEGGLLNRQIAGLVVSLNPALKTLGSSATVRVSIDAHLQAAVQSLLDGRYGNGAVSFNLQTGEVSIDLEALHGGSLNNKPVGYELLSTSGIDQILGGISDAVTMLGDQIVNRVDAELRGASVAIEADIDVLPSQAPLLGKVCVDGQADVDGSVEGLLRNVAGSATAIICTDTSTVLPKLNTRLAVDVNGSVDQLVDGVAASATAKLTALGAPATVNVNAIVDDIGLGLDGLLFDGDSVMSDLVAGIDGQVVGPVVDALTGDGPGTVDTVLTDVLSVTLNNQDLATAGDRSTFTQTALRVAVLDGGDLATLDLAAATVGPNVTRVVTPGGPSDPGTSGTENGSGGPGTDVGTNVTAGGAPELSAFDRLAMTGIGIATLISILLALLAAGAYMVRDSYRRRIGGRA